VTKEETYMGLFSRKPPCPVCGGKVRSTAVKIEGKPICKNCLGKIDVESGRESRLTIRELREYLDFYERNRMLGEKFTVSERFDLGFLDAKIIFDFDNRLFCMGKNPDKTVFEGKHVKFFVIREDDAPIFEGSAEGIRRYPSAVPERAAAMAQRAAPFPAGSPASNAAGKADGGIPAPFSRFNVELYLEHPYWPVITCGMDGPRFDSGHPDVDGYLVAYRTCLVEIVRLVRAIKEVAFPDALEQLAGFYDSAEAISRAAPMADAAGRRDRIKCRPAASSPGGCVMGKSAC